MLTQIMTMFNKIFFFVFTGTIFLICNSCSNDGDDKKFPNSGMYDFANPKQIRLVEELNEISGLTYYPKDTSVFAIVDEDGILYKIPLKNPNHIKQWKFDKKRDFEDLVLVDSTFYILVSNGDIEKVQFQGDQIVTARTKFSDFSETQNEFESLYLDTDSNRLVLICKSCVDDPKKSISRFYYTYKDSVPAYKPCLSVNMAPVAEKLGTNKHLKPSAAAINPITKDLYLVSSILKMVVVFNSKGDFKELFKLDPGLYKQPEGICFTPEGDMVISNEWAEDGFATLLLMKNKKKGK